MFEYFYNEILRRTIIGFGTLFNNLTIKATNASDSVVSVTKVPLAYGPTQKFLARLEQQADLNRSTAMTLPRMSFEFTGLTYDPSRKVTTTQTFVVKDPNTGEETKKGFMPVPYNMQFELAIMCKLNDDALQIVEQILPYFQPAYNLTVELVEGIKERRDVPVVLENITMQDDYDGDFKERRVLLYTLRFTAKTYMYGPVSSATRDIIKVAKVSYISGDSRSTTRDISYTVTPRAIKDYTGEVATTITDDITITTKVIEVEDASGLTAKTYVDLNGEELFIKSISGNKITVNRGQDNTTIVSHVKGSPIKVINDADDALIAEGDDFGFSGTIS
jgi:hypothetical protein|tara:strand:- start:597 stop:1595 length:999 start_codon:yes stop_codon:yes gene_type:complete